jgi:hypothetical protein
MRPGVLRGPGVPVASRAWALRAAEGEAGRRVEPRASTPRAHLGVRGGCARARARRPAGAPLPPHFAGYKARALFWSRRAWRKAYGATRFNLGDAADCSPCQTAAAVCSAVQFEVHLCHAFADRGPSVYRRV